MSTIALKKLIVTNFKGVKHKELSFDGSAKILGENGSGKSTCADAFYFLFGNSNYALVNNPMITPMGMPECVSEVEAEIEINGKPCKVKKTQKYKEKTDDSGKTTSSVTNTFSINDVEKSQRDFVADMTERGLDMDRFLIFSNPNAFMADMSKQGREKMRETLFKMADSYTDEDIINSLSDVDELKALITNYKIDEIEQMQKSTLKKISETCGKDNSVINAKIDGMLSSKAQVDLDALEAQKSALQAEIESIQDEINNFSNSNAEIEKAISDLKNERAEILKKAASDLKKNEADLEFKLVRLDTDRAVISSSYNVKGREIEELKKKIENAQESLENWRDLYKKVQDEVLDESELKCPTCGRELPDNEIEEIKSNFAVSKNERMNAYKARGEEAKNEIARYEIDKAEAEKEYSEIKSMFIDVDNKMEAIRKQLSELPFAPTSTAETEAIDKNIDDLKGKLETSDSDRLYDLKVKKALTEDVLKECIGNIAVGERNVEIDAKVEELRTFRKNAEINKAKAEKILDELDKFKREKNSRLTDGINKHFNIVSFKLFDYLKNGNYQECVELLIDGKPISSCANGSLIQLAKLDCLSGLSNYFDEHYPVFLDDAALVTSNTSDRINIDSQLIQLVATEGIKEIEIKGGLNHGYKE